MPGDDTFHQPFESLLREVGANFLVLRTHWSGMPLGHALASMQLISDELLPALRRVKAED